ncbi:MAG: 4'-phosphopantetheinyl transferase superfamily protein [Actinobacteria bacterium]|uniref:Unannotated protein n=1 Tax=freshwater metagenome TaxID=449393 RepID=A0A6J5ZP29_9ZZZZ|nr:4'-phosphopantetheinyl transferase superfamily protein [Actinomycetota bacterium]
MSEAPRVGIDLLEIERLELALERRPQLALRLFTDQEREYAAGNVRPAQHLAARFCAKEAATKALGLSVLRPLEIEVVSEADGSPSLLLSGLASERAAELSKSLTCSLTHTRSTACAIVIAG